MSTLSSWYCAWNNKVVDASYRVWAEWIPGNWNSCCSRERRWGRSGWTTTKLCLHRDENCEPAGLAEPSTPPIWPGWGWNRRPCPPSPAGRSTSHCRTSPKKIYFKENVIFVSQIKFGNFWKWIKFWSSGFKINGKKINRKVQSHLAVIQPIDEMSNVGLVQRPCSDGNYSWTCCWVNIYLKNSNLPWYVKSLWRWRRPRCRERANRRRWCHRRPRWSSRRTPPALSIQTNQFFKNKNLNRVNLKLRIFHSNDIWGTEVSIYVKLSVLVV